MKVSHCRTNVCEAATGGWYGVTVVVWGREVGRRIHHVDGRPQITRTYRDRDAAAQAVVELAAFLVHGVDVAMVPDDDLTDLREDAER